MDTGSQAMSMEFLERLRAFVRRRVRSDADADDVVQDVLTRLVRPGPPPTGSVHAWLFTVARNVLIDRSRTHRDHVGLDAVDLAEEPPSGDGGTGELARCLGPMLSALSADDQDVLARVDLGGESQADLARELGVSVSAVKSRVQRARRRLRAVLESCCSVAQDARGQPLDFQRRAGADCAGCGADPAC
jgi:RNA polymerase sigma-70 factor (ECF subfamily)